MSDETLRRLLEEAADQVPDTPAPVGELLHTGHERVRRRRATVLAGAVAAMVVVAGGFGLSHLPGGGGSTETATSQTSTSAASSGGGRLGTMTAQGARPTEGTGAAQVLPGAPAGTRWIGLGRVMVAVPETWPMQPEQVCEDSRGTYVSVLAPGIDRRDVHCPMIPADSPGTERVVVAVGGSAPQHDFSCLLSYRPRCSGTTTLDGVVVTYDSSAPDAGTTWQQIESSIRPIPDGYAAVPWATASTETPAEVALADAIGAAGLTPADDAGAMVGGRVGGPAGGSGGDRPLTTSPEPGAVVALGSTVSIHEAPEATAMLRGSLVQVGGPAPGLPRSSTGFVRVVGPGVNEAVWAGATGQWSLKVPPGTYTLDGSDGAAQGECDAQTVTVAAGRTAQATVTCSVR